MTCAALMLIQHHPAEGPGEIANWAAARGITLQIFRADLQQLPLASNAALILLGGPYSAHSELAWLQQERTWLRACLDLGAPVWAICLGAQLLALALGGEVESMPQDECGWCEIRFSDGQTLEVLAWHEDRFLPPAGVPLLAQSKLCRQQMAQYSQQRIGLQFHPEWNASSVAELNDFFGAASPLPRDVDHQRFARVAEWLHQQLDRWLQASEPA